jgi:glycerol-3-phosphate dehydrogenase
MYDVAIIGAGVTGCAVARELSKYKLDVCVLEGENDVATGASRANSAIVHAGYDCEPGTMMAKLNVLGSNKMEALCRELDVPYKRIGSFVLAFDDKDMEILERLNNNAITNGVREVEIISGEETRKIQPNINKDVVAALYAKTAAITCPYELNIALAENAVVNGIEVKIDFRVDKIEKIDNYFKVSSGDKSVEARFVVNAAGLYADEMSKLIGAEEFTILPRKGEYMLLDRRERKGIYKILFQTPSELGKGVLVSPTVDDNVFAGPTALDIDDKHDTSTTQEGLDYLKKLAVRSVPSLNLRNVITQFSGIRAVMKEKHDFLVGESKIVKRFVQAAGICSPGLSASPAMGEEVVSHLVGAGLELKEKENFNPIRKKAKRFREMTKEEKEEAIAGNKLYGRVICRCESVTEAEVVDAIHAPIPARTIDAIKKRTRAGMGRCQGGFCLPRVMEILSRELGISIGEILKSSTGSNIIASGEEK